MRRPVWIFLLAAVVRAGLMLGQQTYQIRPDRDYWGAGWETGRIAWHLVEGRGFALELNRVGKHPPARTAWLAPMYPVLFALVFEVFGLFSTAAFVAIYVIQILLAAWTAALLYGLGRELYGERVGLLAGLTFALWPPAAAFSVNIIWGTTLVTALAVYLLLLLWRQGQGRGLWHATAIGLVMGAILLNEPAVALFYPAAAGWLLWRQRSAAIKPILTMAGVAALCIAPWMIRNTVAFGELFFIKSNLGHELFIGNNPTADGMYHRAGPVVRELYDAETVRELEQAGELKLADRLGALAISYIREDPVRFLRVTARRMWWFWLCKFDSYWRNLTEERVLRKWLRITFDEVLHDLLLILALAGAIVAWRRRTPMGLPLLFALTYPIPYYLTHVNIPRYRFVVVPLVILMAASLLTWRHRAASGGGTD